MATQTAQPPQAANVLTLIRPAGIGWLSLRELWAYRELLYFLVLRDLKVRYRQTGMGVAWAVLQPAATTVIFTLLLGKLAHLASNGIPYPLFAFAGLAIWTYFASALSAASLCLVSSASLISKVYFPRILLVLAAALVPVVDLFFALVSLAVLMAYYGSPVRVQALAAIPFALLAFVIALGAGLGLSSLNVRFRDVRNVLPLVTQIWLFATPVVYTLTSLPSPWRRLAWLNPMTSVMLGFRWALVGTPAPSVLGVAVGTAVALAFLAGGFVYFTRAERRFADIV